MGPKHLTEDQKCLRMGVSFQHLLRYRTEGNNFLSQTVACDKTWCHNDEVWETFEEWFRTQPKTFFADGIHRIVDQWDNCFKQQGDYV